MQSGRGKGNEWVLEHVSNDTKACDPFIGYTSCSDMNSQVKLEAGLSFVVFRPGRILEIYALAFLDKPTSYHQKLLALSLVSQKRLDLARDIAIHRD